eukprot:jgi/Tetstr1/430888/TSEL_020645.t1
MPLVNVGDITQIVDGAALTVENKVEVAVPFMLSLSALAGFEVRTPRQLKVQFNKGKVDTRITTPQLFADLEVPSEVSVLGQTVDLRPVQRLMTPVNSALKSASRTVASVVAPELEFEVPTYLLITYLDDNLRVSRDAGGGVYVMVKDIAIEALVVVYQPPETLSTVMAPVAYALQPGDCVLFHRQAIHGAAGNPMPRPRTALSTRWSTEPCDGRRALTPRYQQDLAAPA